MIDWSSWLPLLVLLTSLVTGIVIFTLREHQMVLRTTLNMTGAILKLVLVGILFVGTFAGRDYEFSFNLVPGLEIVLRVDWLALLFVSLSAVLWLITTIYAIGYMEGAPHRTRFFGFFSLCVTATMGIALAGNLLTFFIFYEMLTLATYPLVVHSGTRQALLAGRNYLFYTLTGGALLLLGIIWLYSLEGGSVPFVIGGSIGPDTAGPWTLRIIFLLMLAGLAVKAAIVPLHAWLPQAMVAPAPVSALLHAVAVVKAGAFGIVRVIYDIFGIAFATELGILIPLAIAASFTIIYGSIRALAQTDLKRRLAYSTVSQLSYIALGATILGPLATTGGLVHLVHQGLMKITLFFCAGNFAETLHVHRIDQLNGIGRRMPLTMAAFTIGAFGMIGIPPVAGFVSKWYLILGGLEAGAYWVLAVLIGSSVLNAMYFLPLVYAGWFKTRSEPWEQPMPRTVFETRWTLLVAAVSTAILSVLTGLFAASQWSPLYLAQLITEQMYQ